VVRAFWLGLSLVVVLGACISYSGERTDRDRITHESFKAGQRQVQLEENGRNGQALHMSYAGGGSYRGGNAVVLLHGVPSSSWMYRYVLEDLQNDELAVIAPDLLGYGSSSKPQMPVAEAAEFYSPSRQSLRIEEVLESLGISEATFVVHDVGGPVAWELASRRPDLFEGLVVLNTIGAPGGFAPPPSMDSAFVQTAMRLVGFEGEGTIRSIVCNMVAEPDDLDTAVQLEGYYQPFREGSSLPYYAFLSNLDIVRDRLTGYQSIISALELPSAVIWGAQDENLLATPSVEWFASALNTPVARSLRLTDAKHLIAEEEPALIAEAIRHVAKEAANR
jgi:pimeloyl-ACP methyl ester carboxylesterase